MACIDKIYAKSMDEYHSLISWAMRSNFKCPNGIVLRMFDYVYQDITDEMAYEIISRGKEIPVMNTSNSADYFIIKYCPLDFVQERMREVYPKSYYESVKNGTSDFDKFDYNDYGNKLSVYVYGLSRTTNYSGKRKFDIKAEYNGKTIWYDSDNKKFIQEGELGRANTNVAHECRSVKALIRFIRKQKFKKGTSVIAESDFDTFVIEVK